MAENIADEAFNSKTVVNYSGNDVDVTNIDGSDGTKKEITENKNAIHQALEEINKDLGRKTE